MVLLWIAFFCSGLVGLSYEITWVRYLNQLFGASTPAVAATVSIFFLGLALGAAVGGRIFDRRRHPLLAYAVLEALIGISAACVPFCFQLAEKWLVGQLHQGAEHPIMWLGVSTLILLLPTTLLGATFPAMAAVLRNRANTTHSTGFFYGFNTLGAVFGCLVVSFWLLPGVGQQYTTYAMAATNFVIAAMLVWVHKRCHLMLEASPTELAAEAPLVESAPPVHESKGDVLVHDSACPTRASTGSFEAPLGAVGGGLALLLAGLSGSLSIGIEVLWTRALALSFPASEYVFALVLAAYLAGIGLGAVAIGAVFRKRQTKTSHLLLLYCAIGVGSALTLVLFARLAPWSQSFLAAGEAISLQAYLGWVGGAAVLAMLPATLAMGAALPLLIGLATEGKAEASRTAGMIYAVNTIGGVLGSLLVTYGLLPWLGLSQSLCLLGMGYIGLAAILAWRGAAITPRLRFATSLGLALGGLAVVVGWFPDANPLRHRADADLLHYREGASATLAVYENKRGHRDLHINNQPSLTSTRPEVVRMQYAVGHLSAILHPSPQRMLLIGFGAGTTLSASSQHSIPAIDCIDRHGQRALASMFAKANHHRSWRRAPHTITRFFTGEPRRLLMRKGPQYDVIANGLTLPGDPGLGALYSLEQFQAARERLTKQGVFVVWLPLSRFGAAPVEVITKTFLTVFPKAEGWMMSRFGQLPVLGLIGRKDDGSITPQVPLQKTWIRHIQRSWTTFHAGKAAAKTKASKGRVAAAVALQMLSPAQLAAWAKDAQINRLERPASSLMLSQATPAKALPQRHSSANSSRHKTLAARTER